MQASGRIKQQHIGMAGDCGAGGIEGHRTGVGTFGMTDHIDAGPFPPDLQLLGSSRPEVV